MLFNTVDFIGFAVVVLAGYYSLGRLRSGHRYQNLFLLVASYYFYAQWDWRFLSLILFSTLVDYFVGLRMHATSVDVKRRRLLIVSLVCNLGLLGVFKYYGFFVDSLVDLLAALQVPFHLPSLHVILPVGISFYTFQTMSYTMDIYRRKLEPTANLVDFALFVAFFPQLVAGPIERARSLLPQITSARRFSHKQFTDGMHLIAWGLYKKVFVADVMAGMVDPLFACNGVGYSGLDLWIGIYAFAFQIYADFSGYTDIARGISKMMGFDLMVNFNLPYFATNPSEFWKRWHISLSSWLREYLYFSLGGSRDGRLRTYRNLLLTMLLGGLWHGASWTFVVWGGFHGIILIIHHYCGRKRVSFEARPWNLRRMLAALVFFQVTCVGWLIFRADSVGQIVDFGTIMATSWSTTAHTAEMLRTLISYSWLLVLVQVVQAATGELMIMRRCALFVQLNFYLLVVFGVLEKFGAAAQQFIYFQF